MPLKLIIANKAYSSWSLRPWILLAHFKIPFEEIVIPLDQPDTRARMLEYSPTGKCPSLRRRRDRGLGIAGDPRIFAENYPDKAIWPSGKAARAHARALAAKCTRAFRRCASIARRNSAARCARSR